MKLIVVDDNKSFLEAVTFFLEEKLHFNVIDKFNSGIELLDSYKLNQVDIILLDIEMPDMDGFEVAKRLLYKYHHLKIVAVTNHTDKVFLNDLISSGFKGFVPKNTVFDHMSKTLNQVYNNEYSFPNYLKIKNL
ncbi:response regulator [Carboxylicivirga linearis]|uniref:Response regulator transcription factor n=1 Tax=Carboxylicivirga linearis TaxID=1628157 RepID=A0ABS5JQC9_9BACT|nr:response regulator transcription factor [Carboxylicivirga linearis]MBS2097079.1 response regulator transcription factor [Carboxylicivirga linearis]